MRTSSTPTYEYFYNKVNGSQYRYGWLQEYFWSRSNIIKQKRDKLGWREPTAYNSYVLSHKPRLFEIYVPRTEVKVFNDRTINGVKYSNVDIAVIPERDEVNDYRWVKGVEFVYNAHNWSNPSYDEALTTDAFLPVRTFNYASNIGIGFSQTLLNELELKALSNLKDQKINLAVTSVEARKSLRTITDGLRVIRRAVKFLRQGNFLALSRLLKHGTKDDWRKVAEDGSSVWLWFQYGIKPILMDIQGAIDELDRKILSSNAIVYGRASRTTTRSYTEKFPGRGLLGQWNTFNTGSRIPGQYQYSASVWIPTFYDPPVELRWDFVQTQRVCLMYELDFSELRRISQLGLINLPALAWELTPYSFVIDWLVSVGDWLNALDATVGLKFKGGVQTYREQCSLASYTTPDASFDTTSSATWKSGNQASGTLTVETKTLGRARASGNRTSVLLKRSRYSSTPNPGIYFKNPFSVTHAISALALTITALKKK